MNIQLRKLNENDYASVGRFIADLNGTAENNICDLGNNPGEIENFIHHDLLDMDAEDGFILAFDEKTLTGVFGLDIDLEKGRAYLLGPYIQHPDWWEIAYRLWAAILDIMPKKVNQARLSPNSQNIHCIEFAESKGFNRRSEGLVLKLERHDFHPSESSEIIELSENQHEAFIKLHELSFPRTYYTGRDILSRCNEYRKVFVDRDVTGYVYVETRPEYGESDIEFIGVHPSGQGKGLGGMLLSKAIGWIFSFDTIDEIVLNVASDNPAIKLYEKLNFRVDSVVYGFEKKLK